MKKLLFFLLVIATAGGLFFGYQSWQGQLKAVHEKSPVLTTEAQSAVQEESEAEEETATAEEGSDLPFNTDLPAEFLEKVKSAEANGDSLSITLVSTDSAALESPAWTGILEERFSEVLNNSSIETFSYEETSDYWADEMAQDDRFVNADIILFELPTIYDNGYWSIDDQEYFMDQIISELEAMDASVFAMPSQPIAGASYYNDEVEVISERFDGTSITYIDHWDEWPSDLENYLTEDNDPTSEANALWGETLSAYFFNQQ
ncbi:hypothetical protein [Jeotgalibacillus haloalkalitolerans]|uniref:SGNH/GDSL hydrolase family protein n=1 Tax=Jeotgalibacillus haloalkalitolerans TaxID=3104292 RepID=A0ABU5KJA5_9BACL|nr:hypothetical protein [Jeotgalibacillus sp. HH7-29]MDZ5711303.1 hypothetical protein [Jeotgalibacillus sp. HH7-29]